MCRSPPARKCRYRILRRHHGTVVDSVGIILFFKAQWASGICDILRPTVQNVADRLGMRVREVEADDWPELCMEYGVLNIPATAVDGRPDLRAIIGALDESKLFEVLMERLLRTI